LAFQSTSTCPECGEEGRAVSTFEGWRPKAYISDVNSNDTYEGFLLNPPVATKTYPLSEGTEATFSKGEVDSDNFLVMSFPGKVVRVNSNGTSGYNFSRVQSGNKMPGVYLEQGAASDLHTIDWRSPENLEIKASNVALYTDQISDILLVTAESFPEGTIFRSESGLASFSANSAWESLAEILAKMIAIKEDIEDREISVGTKFIRQVLLSKGAHARRGVYIVDNLDNGAGYSSSYSKVERFRSLLDLSESRLILKFKDSLHSETCSSSCYHCLRHYDNRFSHPRLDWRLGTDLLLLLKDSNYQFTLENKIWNHLIEKLHFKKLNELLNNRFHIQKTKEGVAYVSATDEVALVPLHPLLDPEHRLNKNVKLRSIKRELGIEKTVFLDVMEFERAPLAEILRVRPYLR
jgi:hypothetical protein